MTDDTINKICGIIYGQALGDAFGLATEFESEKSVKNIIKHMNKSLIDEFPYPYRSPHAQRWTPGDWTDDTDQMILIMQSLIENNLEVNLNDFANKLRNWIQHGFPQVGDIHGMGLGRTVGSVVNQEDFLNNPHEAAVRVWEKYGKNMAANGAVMRTSVVSIVNYMDLEKVKENSTKFCLVTHADPRCVASCIFINVILSLILQNKYNCDYQKVLDEAKEHTLDYLKSVNYDSKDFLKYFNIKKVNDLDLDEKTSIGYTYKCMGCGIYALRKIIKYGENFNFKRVFEKIALKGGDADTNLTVTGAICGAVLGYKNLDSTWLNAMPNKIRFLDPIVKTFLTSLSYSEDQIQMYI